MKQKRNFDWVGSGALKDLLEHIKAGGGYKDFLVLLRDKYGICVSVARLSQLKKQYLIDHVAKELS